MKESTNRQFRLSTRPWNRNTGAVLPISMIMLLLMTTIGLASMRSAQLQTVMATNLQQKKTYFNNAESVSTIGETTWDATLVNCLQSIKECEDSTLLGLTPAMLSGGVKSINWSDEGRSAGNYGNYYIEYLGQRSIPGDLEKRIHLFRLTSLATDDAGTWKTLVQTIYRRCIKIDGFPCPG